MPLQIAKPAPQWKATAVVDGEFKDISLSDYRGKYVVFFFYPLDFTFVCPTEIIAFSDRADDFRKVGCEVIAASTDSHFTHLAWITSARVALTPILEADTFVCPTEIIAFSDRADDFRKVGCEVIAASTDSHFTHLAWINTPRKEGGLGPMNIPIIADKSHKIARDYGILNEETGIPFRGLFIVDDKQNLRQVTINDLPVGRSVDEALRLVQAFQYTDKHGEVCPVNWKPGNKTMKPDTKAAQEYFVYSN